MKTIVKITTTLFLAIAELSILSVFFIKPEPVAIYIIIAMATTILGITGLIMWVIWALKKQE
jgi:hypothetical protein